MRCVSSVPLVLTLALALTASLPAQEYVSHRAMSLDATVGAGRLAGGNFLHRTALAMDATLGLRLRATSGGAFMAGLSGAIQAPWGNAIACPEGGECTGEHPLFYSIGGLLGWERAAPTGPSLRLLAGPALYYAAADGYGRGDGVAALGVQLRTDWAALATTRFALVLSARGALLPDLEGETVGLGAIGMGVRVR